MHESLSIFVGTFLLPHCCKDLMLGMDFLSEHGAVINVRAAWSHSRRQPQLQRTPNAAARPCAASARMCPCPRGRVRSLPCAVTRCAVPTVWLSRTLCFFYRRGVYVERGIVRLKNGLADVLLTNFGNERQHIAKTLSLFKEASTRQTPQLHIDVNPGLSVPKRADSAGFFTNSETVSRLRQQ